LFEKILVPLDGSEHAAHALQKAIQLAKESNGRLTLLHAYTPNIVPLPQEYAIPETTPRMVDIHQEKGAYILEEASKKVDTEGVPFETLLATGSPVETIVEASKRGKFDLIVLGARGLSPIKEVFLGSVSHGVATHAQCPVLVVK